MESLLVWIYLCNAILLINHELDSAYWKEWRLFAALSDRLFGYKDDITGMKYFLIIHFPLWFILLLGLVEVYKASIYGYSISIVVSVLGIGALVIHTYFLRKGYQEFKTSISLFILVSVGMLSVVQLVMSVYLLLRS